ncbi:ATPase [Salibaculum griseiflavum]|uniref:ATPase n=1 Tax=Salibaculum griseiflavum TaxID=1914409 RepID=A0A2V1P3E4_9RHOB|nr:ATPase [Salibaculum griseiflavum]PWG15947.1 ATPase [Salibaculum griseiflavum]
MIYEHASDWMDAAHKRVVFFAMSGLGKTHLSKMLAATGDWFHYSVDYRIGTRYMAEPIADNLKKEAMKVPFLAEMLRADAIHIAANIHDDDLTAVSAYLGKPGDPDRGGLPMAEYTRRQRQFREAEERTLLDTGQFIARAQEVYGYSHFVCDTGGSICEWVDPEDPDDPILRALSSECLMVWIKGTDAHTDELVRRFDRAPKPMAYQPEFLARVWKEYLSENKLQEGDVDPDTFIRWTYAQALAHRQPRYEAMARNWGLTVCASDMASVRDATDFDAVIAAALDAPR